MKSIFDLNLKNLIPWSWMCAVVLHIALLCVHQEVEMSGICCSFLILLLLREDRNGEGNHSLVESGRIASVARI